MLLRSCSTAFRSERPRLLISAHTSPTDSIRSAIVRSVNVRGPTAPRSISCHVHGADTGAPRFGPHGVGGGKRRAVAVAAGIDQDAPAAIGLAEFLREVLRIALHELRADAVGETARPRPKSDFPSSGTTMWKPLEPDVFTQLGRPSSSSRSRSASAAARSTAGHRRRTGRDRRRRRRDGRASGRATSRRAA